MTSTPIATILMPTHAHGPLIGMAIDSILRQTVSDFELFIVGDGTDDMTRAVVAGAAARDARIRYFDFPKGDRHGEAHRHAALQEARGRCVFYCGDDDLWLPIHLERMIPFLETVDFGHSLQINVASNDTLHALGGVLEDAHQRHVLVAEPFNIVGLTSVGHTLAAYRALPRGWHPAPAEIWTDLYMWRQFLTTDGLTFGTNIVATTLHLASPPRKNWPDDRRVEEMSRWAERSQAPSFEAELDLLMRRSLARQSVRLRRQDLHVNQVRAILDKM